MNAEAEMRSTQATALAAKDRQDALTWKQRAQRWLDRIYDSRLQRNGSSARIAEESAQMPARNVLLAAVDVPERRMALDALFATLSETRHHVTAVRARLQPGRGKFENIGDALAGITLDDFDWLLIVDDDVALPARFLDRFLYLSEHFHFVISQPAHRFWSFTTWPVTRRAFQTLARQTRFVECGPVTAFHRSVFTDVVPFPPSRWGWGLDFLWAESAMRRNLAIGVVDALPMRHTRPVGGGYSVELARETMRAFLQQQGVTRPRRDYMVTVDRWSDLS